MYKVYSISTYNSGANSHVTSREETWIFELDKEFDHLEGANDYIETMTKMTPEYRRLAYGKDSSFYETFQTEPRFLIHRRYFLGKPPMKEIRQALETDHINVRMQAD